MNETFSKLFTEYINFDMLKNYFQLTSGSWFEVGLTENTFVVIGFCSLQILLISIGVSRYQASHSGQKRFLQRAYLSGIAYLSNVAGIAALALFSFLNVFTEKAFSPVEVVSSIAPCISMLFVNLVILSKISTKQLPGVGSFLETNISLLLAFFGSMMVYQKDLPSQFGLHFGPLGWTACIIVAFLVTKILINTLYTFKFFTQFKRLFRYFGYGLPLRELENTMPIKLISRRGQKPIFKLTVISKMFREQQEYLVGLLESVNMQLSLLCRYKQNHKKLFKLAELYSHSLMPLANELMGKYQKEAQIPDHEKKSQPLDMMLQAVAELIGLYGRIFSTIYNMPDWRFGPNRQRFKVSAIRIVELALVEQMLSSCRFKQISKDSWLSINTVYTLMRHYETIDFKHQLLQYSHNDKTTTYLRGSIEKLYLQVQIVGAWDYFSFPSAITPVLMKFVKENLAEVTIKSLDLDQESSGTLKLEPGQLLVTQRTEQCALIADQAMFLLKNNQYPQDPMYLIDYSPLITILNQCYEDIVQVLSKKAQFVSRDNFFKTYPKDLQLEIIKSIQEAWYNRNQWGSLNAKKLEPKDWRFYSGFEDCFELIMDLSINTHRDRSLRDKLAERSAFLGEDQTATSESRWYCFYETREHIGFVTQETRFTMLMKIGRLVIYDDHKDGERNPRIGLIVRLERKDNQRFAVILQRLEGYLEMAAYREQEPDLQAKQGGNEKTKLPALLISNDRGRRLIVPSNRKYRLNQLIALFDSCGREKSCRLGKLDIKSAEAIICELEYGKSNQQPKLASNQ